MLFHSGVFPSHPNLIHNGPYNCFHGTPTHCSLTQDIHQTLMPLHIPATANIESFNQMGFEFPADTFSSNQDNADEPCELALDDEDADEPCELSLSDNEDVLRSHLATLGYY